MDIKKELADFGINAVGMVGGIAGSFVKSVLDETEFSFRRAILNVIIAVPLSAYGTMAVALYFNISNRPEYLGVIGLALGLCGSYIGKGIMKLGKRFEKNPENYISVKKQNKGGGSDTDN